MHPFTFYFTGDHVNLQDTLHFVTKELNSYSNLVFIWRNYLKDIASCSESAPFQVDFIPGVLDVDQTADYIIPVLFHALPDGNHQVLVILGVSKAIYT